MNQLFRNQFYIMIKSKSTWGILIAQVLLSMFALLFSTKPASTELSVLKALAGLDSIFCMLIFIVLRTTVFFQNGYVKTIADRVRKRTSLFNVFCVLSTLYLLALFSLVFGTHSLAALIFPKMFILTLSGKFWLGLLMQFMGHLALSFVCILFCCVVRKTSLALAVSFSYVMLFSSLLWGSLDLFLEKMHVAFSIRDWLLLSNISSLSLETSSAALLRFALVSVFFICAPCLSAGKLLKSRDWA